MQNTVVLFSNTDKFVLLQVQLLLWCDIFNYPKSFVVCRTTVVTFKCNTNRLFVSSLIFPSHFLSTVLGYVCCVRQFWKRSGGAVVGLCPVCPVLPSLLCEQQSKHNFIFRFFFFFLTITVFCKSKWIKPDIFCRSPRQCCVRAGAVWNVLCVRFVERLQTPPVCCCAMTVMSAITPTAWTHPCTMFPRVVGSANGKKKKKTSLRAQCFVHPWSFEWGQMEMNAFTYYVKHSCYSPALAIQRPILLPPTEKNVTPLK